MQMHVIGHFIQNIMLQVGVHRWVEWDKRKNELTGCNFGKISLSLIDQWVLGKMCSLAEDLVSYNQLMPETHSQSADC